MDKHQLIPRNQTQKIGLFAFAAAALLALALHNPFSGYVTTEGRYGLHIPGINLFPCEEDWSRNEDGEHFFCKDGRQVRRLALSQWHTQSPASPWIGRLGNLLTLLVVDLLAALVWLLLFRDEKR